MTWGQAIDKAAKQEVDEAVEEAKKSPFPDLKDFWTDIYVSSPADPPRCLLCMGCVRVTDVNFHVK